ncbi:hypothetical protein ACROYT_G029199 [Oculina patagonica]
MLRVDIADFDGNSAYPEYGIFGVTSESDNYKLIIGSYSAGNAGDSLGDHCNRRFSTQDKNGVSCARSFHGAWWYHRCHNSNLNGIYHQYGSHTGITHGDGVIWFTWKGYFSPLKKWR